MRSGIYPFEQFIVDLEQSTGMKFLDNQYADIAKLMIRGERLINPFGSILVRKKMKLYVGNGNFNGTSFRLEDDYMFLDKIGCCKEGLCENQYFLSGTGRHIVLCDGESRDDITYVYWAIRLDENGYPYTTLNHSEALIKFIMWQLRQQDAFLNRGRMPYDMEMAFQDEAAFAAGEDFFPNQDQLEQIAQDNQTEMIMLWTKFDREDDGCIECSCVDDFSETDPSETPVEDENTAPTIEDNEALLQVEPYQFSFSSFTNEYFDAQGHLPGTLVFKSLPDAALGTIYRIPSNPTLPSIVYPTVGYEMDVNLASELYFQLNSEIYINSNGDLVQFPGVNIYQRIEELLADGYSQSWTGAPDCDLVFTKESTGNSMPNDTDLFFFIDGTSIDIDDAEILAELIKNYVINFRADNDSWTGDYFVLPTSNERWVQYGSTPWTGVYTPLSLISETVTEIARWNAITKIPDNINSSSYTPRENAIVVAFVDEAATDYHSPKLSDGFGNITQLTTQYYQDYLAFRDTVFPNYNYFKGSVEPTILSTTEEEAAFALQVVAAIEGVQLTAPQIAALNCPADLSLLLTENPYENASVLTDAPVITGLTNHGWGYHVDRSGPHSTDFDLATINALLADIITYDVATTIDTVTLDGTCLDNEEICFTFAVKEQSADELESNTALFCFTKETITVEKLLWWYQFDDINNSNVIGDVDLAWITANGTSVKLADLLAGVDIPLPNVGRFGFVIQTAIEQEYDIYQFGLKITDQFTRQYDGGENLEVFLSDNNFTPGDQTIQFKSKLT